MREDELSVIDDASHPTDADPLAGTAPPTLASEEDEDPLDESLGEQVAELVDNGRTWLEAEAAFQKVRAKIAGRSAGMAAGLLVVAAITGHIAVLALAVGLVIALEPLLTIWGAIAVVVGMLLIATGVLVAKARGHIDRLSRLANDDDPGGAA